MFLCLVVFHVMGRFYFTSKKAPKYVYLYIRRQFGVMVKASRLESKRT